MDNDKRELAWEELVPTREAETWHTTAGTIARGEKEKRRTLRHAEAQLDAKEQ